MHAMHPLFTVDFRDKETANNLGPSVISALRNVAVIEDVRFALDNRLQLRAYARQTELPPPSSPSPPPSLENENDSIFFIEDTHPTIVKTTEIPTYTKKFDVLNSSKKEDTPPETPRGMQCFNCDGDHSMRDCTEPRNFARIDEKRKEANKVKFSRYHIEDQNDDNDFIPGSLSRELRKALGLQRNQLPLHIYKMRIFGYPPGWLLHAKVTHSGLSLFDSQGKEVKNSEDDVEGIQIKDKFDVKKIFSFPGYNVRASSKYIDESKEMGYPPYSETNSKLTMIEQLAPLTAKAYLRKKLKKENLEAQSGDVQVQMDMDIDGDEYDEFNGNGYDKFLIPHMPLNICAPPLPPDYPPPLPPPCDIPPPPPLELPPLPPDEPASLKYLVTVEKTECKPIHSNDITPTASRSDSPTLADLEAEKMTLISALNEENDDNFDKRLCSEDSNSNVNEESQSSIENQSTSVAEISCSTPKSNLNRSKPGSVCNSDFGTPVLSYTPYSKLPSATDFSKDIQDVIDFENLPDYTGKFKKICKVIKKIRETTVNLHDME